MDAAWVYLVNTSVITRTFSLPSLAGSKRVKSIASAAKVGLLDFPMGVRHGVAETLLGRSAHSS